MTKAADCLFCKIVAGAIPAKRVYENEGYLAFPDIQPQAKQHYLVIPKKHVASQAEADRETLGGLLEAVNALAAQEGLARGFRTVINVGEHGGQTVFHLHAHLLGGEDLDGGFGK